MTEEAKTKVSHLTILWDDDTFEEIDNLVNVAYLPQGNQVYLQVLSDKGNLTNYNLSYIKRFKFYNEVVH